MKNTHFSTRKNCSKNAFYVFLAGEVVAAAASFNGFTTEKDGKK
jgi:hypothetical protein